MREGLPNRQSIRKKGWDYTSPGWYFVTCNTHGGKALFGAVVNGRMVLSEAGNIAQEEWFKSAVIRRNIELDEFVVMPDHVHGLMRIKKGAPGHRRSPKPQFGKPIAGALGTFVGAYKAAVSREMHRRGLMHQTPAVWHRNYWDVIVRDDRALANIR
jgi:putative transposase